MKKSGIILILIVLFTVFLYFNCSEANNPPPDNGGNNNNSEETTTTVIISTSTSTTLTSNTTIPTATTTTTGSTNTTISSETTTTTPVAVTTTTIPAPIQYVPIASSVSISGTAMETEVLTGNYTYSDANGDAESGTTFRWLSSSESNGTYTAITGATSKSYTLQSSDIGKYIKFEVTPKNGVAPTTGTAVLSSQVGPIVINSGTGGVGFDFK